MSSVDDITSRARDVEEALFRLEDVLDAMPVRVTDPAADAVLRRVWARWNHDTARKINRAITRPDLARSAR